MEKGYIGRFRGIPVIIKSDDEVTEIVLPESFATHVLELQEDKTKYMQEELKSIFPDIDI